MREIIDHSAEEFRLQPGDDPRVVRAIESGYALPNDISEMRTLAHLARFSRRFRGARVFDEKLTQLSDEIVDTPNNIAEKIQGLNI